MCNPVIEFCDDLNAPAIGFIWDDQWWHKNQTQITEWLTQQGISDAMISPVLIYIADPHVRTCFMLKWLTQ
jgi:hypothetical protein